MYCSSVDIVLQEVPGEISLCFSITGCPLRCVGCHSPHLWKEGNGICLTESFYLTTLNEYQGLATTVLFMGGEWHEEELVNFLSIAQKHEFKTCLYSGYDLVSEKLRANLTWLKTGAWQPERGGLKSKITNQRFIEVRSNTLLNHLFH